MKVQNLLLIQIICVGFLPNTQAVVPPPDGGYPGLTTAEGTNALKNLTSGQANTGVGWYSLFTNSTASYNTGVGAATLVLNNADENTGTGTGALFLNTSGVGNTANGAFALIFNDTGVANTAAGNRALFSNTEGNFNTATGHFALHDNTTGIGNTANGASALQHNSTGGLNTAVGGNALSDNTTGTENTATGANALSNNINGENNTAVGAGVLQANNANGNTAIGSGALSANTTGIDNTATGLNALQQNTSGAFNTAIGESSLFSNVQGSWNTAIGDGALSGSTASLNIGLGFGAGSNVSTASNVICIGALGADVSNSCFIGQIFAQSSPSGVAVLVNSDGKLGTVASSRRFKEKIKPMNQASEALFALQPVTFHYKKEVDSTGVRQLGLVAEDVERVNPDLVVRDKEGKAYSVRYDQVNAMLLNEFLKEHRMVQEQQREIDSLKLELKEQRALIQKVNDKVELAKTAPQTVSNNLK